MRPLSSVRGLTKKVSNLVDYTVSRVDDYFHCFYGVGGMSQVVLFSFVDSALMHTYNLRS